METVVVTPRNHGFWLSRGRRVLKIGGPVPWLRRCLALLRDGCTVAELARGGHEVAVGRLLDQLDAERWLAATDRLDRAGSVQERQIGYLTLFGPDAEPLQRALDGAVVGVLGLGGVGCLVAQHLVTAGVRRLWLMDPDVVAAPNLNRQHLYRLGDVGRPKVEAAAGHLAGLGDGIDVRQVRARVAAVEDLQVLPDDLDLLVNAADTPSDLNAIVAEWARPRGIATVTAALGLDSGYWGPLLDPHRGHCPVCFEKARSGGLTTDERALESAESSPTAYSFGPANAVVSAFLAHDVVRFLATGEALALNRRAVVDFSTGQIRYLTGPICSCSADRAVTASTKGSAA
ncbi:ThiF family adenylyltransferase [Micromonospora sp. NPDC004336]